MRNVPAPSIPRRGRKNPGILVLASASPRRSQLLREAGINFRVHPAAIRELDQLHRERGRPLPPRQIALRNARLKALTVARCFPRHCVLGADTVVVLGRKIFGKPSNRHEAETMLNCLNGRTHRVITAFCLCRGKTLRCLVAVTSRVTLKRLTRRQIRVYLRLINPLDKAGAYAAQEHGDRIIRKVEGSWSNVVGLPMERLLREMRKLKPSLARAS